MQWFSSALDADLHICDVPRFLCVQEINDENKHSRNKESEYWKTESPECKGFCMERYETSSETKLLKSAIAYESHVADVYNFNTS